MAEGNEHLLKEPANKPQYSAMDIEEPKSPSLNQRLLDSGDDQSANPSLALNKRALVIFFGVTVVTAALIVMAVVVSIYSGGFSSLNRAKRSHGTFTLNDVFSGKYSPERYSVKWLSDDEYLHRIADGKLEVMNPAHDSPATELVSAENMQSLGSPNDYKISPDRTMLLYSKNRKMQYRYSSFADYYIYIIKENKSVKIPTADSVKIQYVAWAPSGNSLIYVINNDMYFIKDVRIPLPDAHRLTNTGKEHKIFNGVPDWVYQEEVLNSDHAMYFSPDSHYLAYIQFNDEKVKDYVFPWYGPANNSYTTQHKIAYPKSGTANPTVKVKLLDLQKLPVDIKSIPRPIDLHTPTVFSKVDHYVVNIGWPTQSIFTVQWLNRVQNHSVTNVCPVSSSGVDCFKGHELRVSDGWVDDSYITPVFSKDQTYYLVSYPFTQGNQGDFIHIAKVNLKDRTVTDLTSGPWEVTKILAFDDNRQMVFYESTEKSPTQRHIYSFSIKKNEKNCLTCNLPSARILDCSYFSADFSLKGSWYVLYCLGPGIPQTHLHSSKTDKVVILQMNEDLKEKLKNLPPTKTEFIKVRSRSNDINVKLVYPPYFSTEKKYAVFFSVYGGPGTQNVLETWGLGFESGFLVHTYDLIMVYVDARGTRGRGERFKHAVYRQLGRYEAEDTINVARYMQQQSYVAKDKIAIWGWSYGGYLTSYILGQKSGAFQVGMAVAPVADWRYYDTIYTERWMGLPQDNVKGYKESSVLPLVKNFKNISYLLIHGTGDDNVHFQNSAQLVKRLTEEEINYRVQFYTDRNHGLNGGGTGHHLYHLLTSFLTEKLAIKPSSSS